MNKSFKLFLTMIFTFSILLTSLVYSVGFHTADEIIDGSFPGDYVFNGNISVDNMIGVKTVDPQYLLDVRYAGDYMARFGNDDGADLTIDVAAGQGLVNLVAGAKVTSGTNNYEYTGTRGASRINLHDGLIRFYTSDSTVGVKGDAVTWNTGLTINQNGNVGIGGSASSSAKLEVIGGPIKATGGLIIETRTNDPATPAEGQMWMRTDI